MEKREDALITQPVKRRFNAPLLLLACAALASPIAAFAAAAPPDFTGVWANTNSGATLDNQLNLPLKPEAKKRVDAYTALVAPTGDTPGGVCLGAGTPSVILGGASYPLEVIQRPDQITLIYELHGETRRIYFGDRNAPQEDRIPGRGGYSSGRWEGDVLVVETDNLFEQLDGRIPHSADAKVTERYSVNTDPDGVKRLKVELKVDDPTFYTAPVTTAKQWTYTPNGRLLPYECAEEVWLNRLTELARKAGTSLP